ncbi:MAG TPA: PspC domain-containing protein [Cytophagaceae bacterium]|nr:PspC domain-containing protein [Cytophagaceae bacterium]
MENLKTYLEKYAFGVCASLGEKFGIASASIRLFFIYTSFLTFGSPLVLYLILAFLMNFHKHLRNQRSTVWDV